MTASTQKTLAITLVLLFIAILLIALASGWEKQKQQEKDAQTSVPQTTYVILESPSVPYSNYRNYRDYSDRPYSGNYENQYEHDFWEPYEKEPEIKTGFSYYGKKEQEKDFLGSYITKYLVSVLNKGNTGNYFTVTFNFENQQGFEYSEAITQYLRAGERKEFLYKDVQFERTEILSWGYRVERV